MVHSISHPLKLEPKFMNSFTDLIKLKSGEVHLWFSFHDGRGEAVLNELYLSLLSSSELEQQMRFHFSADRYSYLLTRAMVRTVLSRYAAVLPMEWEFTSNGFGRPELIDPGLAEVRGLSFNLSHTQGLIVIGVTRDAEIGVDAEGLDKPNMLELADGFFARSESIALHKLPPELLHDRFFELWTLKESYIKARGMGLSIPLDQFSFTLDRKNCIEVNFASELKDVPEHWSLFQLRPSSKYIVSVCVERFHLSPVPPICREIVPLSREQKIHIPPTRSTVFSEN